MEAFLTGCALAALFYIAMMWLVVLGIVVHGSRNPGWLQMLADLMDDPPPVQLTERQFLMSVAYSVGLAWPIYLAALLSSDGPWRG